MSSQSIPLLVPYDILGFVKLLSEKNIEIEDLHSSLKEMKGMLTI